MVVVPGGRPTMYDVAARAGVSHMTVSRVLNSSPSVRPDTRDRVLAAMDALNYHPSSAARSLATDRTMRIGALVDTPGEYGPNSTLVVLDQSARERGYAIVPYSLAPEADDSLREGVAHLQRMGMDALCVIGLRASTSKVLKTIALDVPVIVIGNPLDSGLLSVDTNQAQGTMAAVAHLLALGHRAILHVAGPTDTAVGADRERSWRRALDHAGCAARRVDGDWSSDSGYRIGASAELMRDATAVFAANDQMALGIIHGLSSRGVRVPEDVSIVGFDDSPGSAHFMPPLTTVRQDFAQLGEVATRALVAKIDGLDSVSSLVATTLIVRASTAPPKSQASLISLGS